MPSVNKTPVRKKAKVTASKMSEGHPRVNPLTNQPLSDPNKRHLELKRLYKIWAIKKTWLLQGEAMSLLIGVTPGKKGGNEIFMRGIGALAPVGLKSTEQIKEQLILAGTNRRLPIVNIDTEDDPAKWRIRPPYFLAYLRKKKIAHHSELAEAILKLGPLPKLPSNNMNKPAPARTVKSKIKSQILQQILESGYSNPDFDLALAAIVKFWLPGKQFKLHGGKTIRAWIDKQLQNSGIKSSANRAHVIDQLIRPQKYRRERHDKK